LLIYDASLADRPVDVHGRVQYRLNVIIAQQDGRPVRAEWRHVVLRRGIWQLPAMPLGRFGYLGIVYALVRIVQLRRGPLFPVLGERWNRMLVPRLCVLDAVATGARVCLG
jgi:hypothetical protein